MLKMILLPLLLSLAAAAASAARIRSLTHSGPGCPQDARVTWSGDLSDLTITLPDFSESLAAGQMTSCQVHLLIDQGESGKSLVLQDVVVRGGLYLSPNSKVDFYTTAYWSETASDTQFPAENVPSEHFLAKHLVAQHSLVVVVIAAAAVILVVAITTCIFVAGVIVVAVIVVAAAGIIIMTSTSQQI
ncbi:hypothetical protein CGCVW01_v006930 [Colletotrichum viniferum]|nr:hypothetical protein CGCVW01_v006930 [Colletotrichum viniferum]